MVSNAPTHDEMGNLLPAILCLHGGGSNAVVFKIQTRRLQWNLNPRFRFIFPQAPIEGTPGWGMMPVFESCRPFYRWVSRKFAQGEADVEITPEDEVEVIDAILLKLMNENGGVESFAGVIGFSQGARLAMGLLLRQTMEIKEYGESKWKFKFGTIIGGPFPPIALTPPTMKIDYDLLQKIPTVHAWGRDDMLRMGCKQQLNACRSMKPITFFMDFEGTHHLPLTDGEARQLTDLMLEAYEAGQGA